VGWPLPRNPLRRAFGTPGDSKAKNEEKNY
jgi:hypothetical protein